MIYSKLVDIEKYIVRSLFIHISEFLQKISPEISDGKYDILGEDAFARVMSYETKEASHCAIEAHDRYIDIQSSIVGAEGISVFDREALTEIDRYDAERDVRFFDARDAVAIAYTVNTPGYFTMLFPQEAHRPQEYVPNEHCVKKFVIKVSLSAFGKRGDRS